MTRLTNAFSRKGINHNAALAVYLTYYNFCRVHQTLRSHTGYGSGHYSSYLDCKGTPQLIGFLRNGVHHKQSFRPLLSLVLFLSFSY
jgi:hypothetical protein